MIASNTKVTVLPLLLNNESNFGLQKITESLREQFYLPGYELDIGIAGIHLSPFLTHI